MTHVQLQNNIVKYAKLKGYKCQFFWRNFHSPKGWLDLTISKPPRLLMVELKVPPDTLTKEQSEWFEVWGKYPYIERYVWKPEDWISGVIVKILDGDKILNNDSPNAVEDTFPRPEGLCKTCVKECYSDWVIELCSEYKKDGK